MEVGGHQGKAGDSSADSIYHKTRGSRVVETDDINFKKLMVTLVIGEGGKLTVGSNYTTSRRAS